MRNLLQFIQYHNAVPIAISVLLLGAGGAFAATDPQAIYSQQQKVVSIDNSYLLHTDFSTYTPSVLITGVTEDSGNYYVAYTLSTIDLQNGAWQNVQKQETMQVSKADLGPYRDLGVYVTQKLSDVVNRELDRLKQTQSDEMSAPSQEQVVTEYSGLVGKFLNARTDVLPGYTPVVQAPTSTTTAQVAAANAPSSMPGDNVPGFQSSGASGSSSASPASPQNTSAPALQILGNNPAEVAVGATYTDLGASVTSPPNSNLGVHVFVDGTEVQQVIIDTSNIGDWSVMYKVTDQNGNTATATRTVHVFDPNAQQQTTSTPDAAPSVPDTSASSTGQDDSSDASDPAPSAPAPDQSAATDPDASSTAQ
jgi:hypothetical protein